MLVSHKLPILQKAALFKRGHIQPISKYHALCLSFIVPHGSTDIWMHPVKKYFLNYGSSCVFFLFQSLPFKFASLFLYSLYHVKNDIVAPLPIQLAYSAAVHSSWIFFPEWALTYLAWIHTTLHYKRVLPFLNPLQIITLFTSHLFVYFLIQKYETDDLMFNGVWIPIVIGHIMTNA